MKMKYLFRMCLLVLVALGFTSSSFAAQKTEFTLVDSVYAGWMPSYYADSTGILKKHADKRGIKIKVVHAANYGASIEAYSPGSADALAITSMDVLMSPAIAGVDSTAVILGDFSNGNDVVYGRKGKIESLAGLKGKKVHGVPATVSEYLLARGLETIGAKHSAVEMALLEDTAIAPAFLSGKIDAAVTWAPFTLAIEQDPKAVKLFDSSRIPGEILDLIVVKTDVLKDNPAFGEALAGAWYEVLAIMSKRGPASEAALAAMAKMSECTLAEYKAQLKTTAMFWTPDSAIGYLNGEVLDTPSGGKIDIKSATDRMRKFLFEKGFLGDKAKSADHFGIEFPDGKVLGNPRNVRLRYTTTYTATAKQ